MDKKKIVLENGREFYGYSFGADCDAIAELVFNTSMVGYQEIISDPCYCGQAVMMTYPLIGNYGITDDDFESKQTTISGLIVRDYNDIPSNFRYTKTLGEVLVESGIPAICEVDTRTITRILRDEGTMKAMIVSADFPSHEAQIAMKHYAYPTNSVAKVSCKKRWYSRTYNQKYNIIAIDCGIKLSAIRALNSLGCNITVVPYSTTASEIMALQPDGVFVSGGPGNPADIPAVAETIKTIIGKAPLFGTGIGHSLIALACGCKVYKMKCGHNGGNHPVKELSSGYIKVVPQSHSYAVDAESVKNSDLKVTHINILDSTIEGLADENKLLFTTQYSPDGDVGPFGEISEYRKFLNTIDGGNK